MQSKPLSLVICQENTQAEPPRQQCPRAQGACDFLSPKVTREGPYESHLASIQERRAPPLGPTLTHLIGVLQRRPALRSRGRHREGWQAAGQDEVSRLARVQPHSLRGQGRPQGRGPGPSRTGRDKPGVLTPSRGLLHPGGCVLDIGQGVDARQAQLGEGGHRPGWGCRGEDGRLQVPCGASGPV